MRSSSGIGTIVGELNIASRQVGATTDRRTKEAVWRPWRQPRAVMADHWLGVDTEFGE
jgi:hypothetical protein